MAFLKKLTSGFAWLILIAILLLLGTLAALVIRPDWFSPALSKATYQLSGLSLQLEDVHTSMNPARIEIRSLSMRNEQWPEPELLNMSELVLSFSDWPALETPFWKLAVKNLSLRVERDASGRINWLARTPDTTAATPAPTSPQERALPTLPTDFNFESVDISNLRVRWVGSLSERDIEIQQFALKRTEAGTADVALKLLLDNSPMSLQTSIKLDPAAEGLNIDLAAKALDIAVTADGMLLINPTLQGSHLDFSITAPNLSALATALKTELPSFENLSVSGSARVNDGYALNNLNLKIGENAIHGKIETDFSFTDINSSLHSERLDIDALLAAMPATAEAPAPAPEAVIPWQEVERIKGRHSLAVDVLTFSPWTASKLNADIRHDKDIRLAVNLAKLEGAAEPLTNIALDTVLTPMPSTEPGADAVLALTLNSDLLAAKINGPVNLNGIAGTKVKTVIAAPKSAALWRLAEQPWGEGGPINIDALIATTDDNYRFEGQLSLGEGTAIIETALTTGNRSNVDATIAVSNFDLSFLESAPATTTSGAAKQQSTAKADQAKYLFTEDAIDFGPLRNSDARISLELENIKTSGITINGADLRPELRAGKLSLNNGKVSFPSGQVSLNISIDASREVPTANFNLTADRLTAADLGLTAAGKEPGNGSADIDLYTKGSSARQLASHLTGKIDMQISGFATEAAGLNIIGGDIFNETLNALNPLRKDDPATKFECVSAVFAGNEGRFESDGELIIETDRMKVVGTGTIDLRKEKLDIAMSPVAKRGLGVNLSSLVQMVKVGGSLRNPGIRANVSGMVNSGLSATAALSTGGLSMIAESLIKRAINQGSPCDPASKPDQFIVEPKEGVIAESTFVMEGRTEEVTPP